MNVKMQKRFITKGQIKRGKAPQPPIQRSIASPSVLAKVMYDKFSQYLPLYRQVKEWERYGLNTNDKNLPIGSFVPHTIGYCLFTNE